MRVRVRSSYATLRHRLQAALLISAESSSDLKHRSFRIAGRRTAHDRSSVEVAILSLKHPLRLAARGIASEGPTGDRRATERDRKERAIAKVGKAPQIPVRCLEKLNR